MRAREFLPPRLLAEVDTIKPEGSLNADQWRKRSAKRTRVQQQQRDEEARHVAKVRDLQARMA